MKATSVLVEMYLGKNSGSDNPDRRIRITMHLALVAFLFMLVACGLAIWAAEWQRKHDYEIVDLAGIQRAVSQKIVIDVERIDAVESVLESISLAEEKAATLDKLLGLGNQADTFNSSTRLITTAFRAKNIRDDLFATARTIVKDRASSAPTEAEIGYLREKSVASFKAADTLVQELRRHFEAKFYAAAEKVLAFGVGCFLLIIAVALWVVEPMARIIKTQHLRIAKQLEEGRRLALVAERTNNVVLITNARREITWANDAFTRVSGYTLEEAIGKSPGQLLQTESTDASTIEQMRQALNQQLPVQVEILNRSKDGAEYWLELDIQPLHDEQGVLTGFIAVETEITEKVLKRERLRAVLNTLPAGVIEYDAATGVIVGANQAAGQIFGVSTEQLLGRPSADNTWRAVRDDLTPYPGEEHPVNRSLQLGEHIRGDLIGIVASGGDQRWLNLNTAPICDPNGHISGAVACFVDVTEQRAQRTLLQMALHAAKIGTWQWRVDGGEHSWSEASCSMLGYSLAEFSSQLPNWRDRIHPADRLRSDEALRKHLIDPSVPYACEMRMRHRHGHWVWVQVFGEVLERDATAEVQRMVGIHIDISDRKRHEDELVEAAMSDPLTGLPNRANVLKRIDRLIAGKHLHPSNHFALLFLDFDRFKQVNDTLGHAAGDELLRQIAERLKNSLRPGDMLGRDDLESGETAARLGGDEFVVLLGQLQKPLDACLVADRLLKTLSQPYSISGQEVYSSASIGIVHSDLPFEDADGLLRDADTAMYEAKQTGRGRWVLFETRMREKITQRVGLEADLHVALTREELFVVYQPVMALDDPEGLHGCAGVEALVRWSHPERGMVPPMQFIPVAEESGLISQLGEFVLRTACRQFVSWQQELGVRAPKLLAVNLSVAQLRQTDLVARVQAALNECGMHPSCLQLEVTESLAAQDPLTQERLRDLKSLGIKLALDDFGTGYSSLACLHQLPVDTVKIDRSFVAEAERSEYHLALIEATVRVARTLRMKTVAEGIETASQSDLVHTLGCDRGQGYFFSKPLTTEQLGEWLVRRNSRGTGTVVSLSARRSGMGD